MAANYWASTQRKFWLFTREQLAEIRDEQAEKDRAITLQFPLPDRRLVNIYLKDQLMRLSKRLTTRQQVYATSMVYMHRYFLFTPIYTVNPYLLISTAYYLASKTEESPNHIRLVVSEARQHWPEFISGDVSRVGEMEFSLISELRSQLIVWHPYRTLMDLKENSSLGLTNEEVSLAWSVINDSYLTDLPLTCPPHLIAMMAVFLSIIFQPRTTVGLQSPTQPQVFPAGGQNSFHSLGGRPGIADSVSNSLNRMVSPQNPTTLNLPVSGKQEIPLTDPSAKAKAIAAAFSSEKIQRLLRFLAESEIDLEQMIEATQEIISLYEVWEQYTEKSVRDAFARYIKERGLDK